MAKKPLRTVLDVKVSLALSECQSLHLEAKSQKEHYMHVVNWMTSGAVALTPTAKALCEFVRSVLDRTSKIIIDGELADIMTINSINKYDLQFDDYDPRDIVSQINHKLLVKDMSLRH